MQTRLAMLNETFLQFSNTVLIRWIRRWMTAMYWQQWHSRYNLLRIHFRANTIQYRICIPKFFCFTADPNWATVFDFCHALQLPSNSASAVGQQITSIHNPPLLFELFFLFYTLSSRDSKFTLLIFYSLTTCFWIKKGSGKMINGIPSMFPKPLPRF